MGNRVVIIDRFNSPGHRGFSSPFSAGFQIVTHPIGPLDELAFKHPAAEIMDLITGLVTGPGSYRVLFAEWVARFQVPLGGYCLPYYV